MYIMFLLRINIANLSLIIHQNARQLLVRNYHL